MTPRATQFTHELKDVLRSNGKQGVDKHVSIMMEYDFFAEDGSKITVGPIPAEGLDTGDKATNKALSAALKYALIQTFSIPTEDMAEADLDSPELGVSNKTASKSDLKSGESAGVSTTSTAQPTAQLAKPEVQEVKPLQRSSFRNRKTVTPIVETTTSSNSDSDWA
jgi:hypothetical protein